MNTSKNSMENIQLMPKDELLFRHPDGTFSPFNTYYEKNKPWKNVVFAEPGAGMSFLLNRLDAERIHGSSTL